LNDCNGFATFRVTDHNVAVLPPEPGGAAILPGEVPDRSGSAPACTLPPTRSHEGVTLADDGSVRTRRHRRRSAALALVAAVVPALAFLFGDVSPAHACSCVGFTDEEAFAAADVVFTGTVASVSDPDRGLSTAPRVFTFAVDEVFKGDVAPQQVVRSEQSGASCGLEITGRGPFVVYATSTHVEMELGQNELYAGLCGGTRPLDDAPLAASLTEDAHPPDPGIVVEPPAAGSSRRGLVVAALVVGGGVVAVAMISGGAMLRRRGRPGTTP
jgi:hypothetical protein